MYRVGTIFCVNKEKEYYAIIIKETNGNIPEYTLNYMVKAKPFEHSSVLCIEGFKFRDVNRTHLQEKPEQESLGWFKCSDNLMFSANEEHLRRYDKTVFWADHDAIGKFIETLNDNNKLKTELLNLKSLRKAYMEDRRANKTTKIAKKNKKISYGKIRGPGMGKSKGSVYTQGVQKRPLQGGGFSPR